ncbi:MAG: N-acetylmuramoyl-L-alanine amidase [Butyricicoccaceae bacterium]
MSRLGRRSWVVFAAVMTAAAFAVVVQYRGAFPIIGVFSASQSDCTLVLDAGHGGMDGGAVAADGTAEQDINLSIALRCRELAELCGVPTVMTREDTQSLRYDPAKTIRQNKVADIRARAEITQNTRSPVFVSVHLNKFTDTAYRGAQVFWSKNNPDGKLLAESIQSSLIAGISDGNKRAAKQAVDSIWLMKTLTCPAVIVECGFLSNVQEAELLKQDAYQRRLALCIVSGYLNVYHSN